MGKGVKLVTPPFKVAGGLLTTPEAGLKLKICSPPLDPPVTRIFVPSGLIRKEPLPPSPVYALPAFEKTGA